MRRLALALLLLAAAGVVAVLAARPRLFEVLRLRRQLAADPRLFTSELNDVAHRYLELERERAIPALVGFLRRHADVAPPADADLPLEALAAVREAKEPEHGVVLLAILERQRPPAPGGTEGRRRFGNVWIPELLEAACAIDPEIGRRGFVPALRAMEAAWPDPSVFITDSLGKEELLRIAGSLEEAGKLDAATRALADEVRLSLTSFALQVKPPEGANGPPRCQLWFTRGPGGPFVLEPRSFRIVLDGREAEFPGLVWPEDHGPDSAARLGYDWLGPEVDCDRPGGCPIAFARSQSARRVGFVAMVSLRDKDGKPLATRRVTSRTVDVERLSEDGD